MKNKNRFLYIIGILLALVVFCSFSAFATDNGGKLDDINAGIISIAYRGDTANYPENSLEAVKSAFKIGADMVSVSVGKTSDGVLVLCDKDNLQNVCETEYNNVSAVTYDELSSFSLYGTDGKTSKFKIATLEKAIKSVPDNKILVIDNAWDYRDKIYDIAENEKAIKKILIRTDISSKDIVSWTSLKKEPVFAIGIYKANIIFNAVSHINRLAKAGMPAVQYESKNYFNVMYGSILEKKYGDNGIARAVAPMFDKDKCGQRSDSETGWDEMISKGFSVIETNNISQLVSYIGEIENVKDDLKVLIEKTQAIDSSLYSQVSAGNLSKAKQQVNSLLKVNSSLSELQESYSTLLYSMENLAFKSGQDTQKGNLNITAGKIVAVIIVGAALFAGQIFVHKMRKEKKKK